MNAAAIRARANRLKKLIEGLAPEVKLAQAGALGLSQRENLQYIGHLDRASGALEDAHLLLSAALLRSDPGRAG
jgi:hypothetical protein